MMTQQKENNDAAYIDDSEIDGSGAFSNRRFEKGERIIPAWWLINDELFKSRRFSGQPITYPIDLELHDITWFINHQTSANCEAKQDGNVWHCVALKPIEKGCELTLDYKKFPKFMKRNTRGYTELDDS